MVYHTLGHAIMNDWMGKPYRLSSRTVGLVKRIDMKAFMVSVLRPLDRQAAGFLGVDRTCSIVFDGARLFLAGSFGLIAHDGGL